ILRGDDVREVVTQVRGLEHEVDLAAQRTRDDRQAVAGFGRGPDELDRPRHQLQGGANGPLIEERLPLDRLLQPRRVRRQPHPLEGVAEALAIVEAEVVPVVPLAVEGVTIRRQGGDQRLAVLRFVVDDDTIEIEEDRPGHGGKIVGAGPGGGWEKGRTGDGRRETGDGRQENWRRESGEAWWPYGTVRESASPSPVSHLLSCQ